MPCYRWETRAWAWGFAQGHTHPSWEAGSSPGTCTFREDTGRTVIQGLLTLEVVSGHPLATWFVGPNGRD